MSETVDELLRRVDRALEDYAQADIITRRVTSLTNLGNEVSPYVKKLGQVVAGFEVLEQVHKPADRPETRALAATCRQAAGLVRRDKSGPQDLPRTFRQINDVVNNASVTIRDAWREYIDARMPGLDSLSDLAGMLGDIRGDRLQAGNLKKAAADLRTLSRRLPDEFSQDQATKLVIAIRASLIALLGGDSYADNDEVRRFIEAVAGGGAHVRTLTTPVREWMDRIGVEDSFKILAGRPACE